MPHDHTDAQGALFDVQPVDDHGAVDVARMSLLPPVIDLRRFAPPKEQPAPVPAAAPAPVRRLVPHHTKLATKRPAVVPKRISIPEPQLASAPAPERSVPNRREALRELEAELSRTGDPHAVLASAGARVTHPAVAKPRYRPVVRKPVRADAREDDLHRKILTELRQQAVSYEELDRTPPIESSQPEPATPSPVELAASQSGGFGHDDAAISSWYAEHRRTPARVTSERVVHHRRTLRTLVLPVLLLAAFGYAATQLGVTVKDRVVQRGTAGAQALQDATQSLATLDFVGASSDFSLAYERFAQASKGLNVFGASISSFIAGLPGGHALASANGIIETGKLIADAGQAMSDALDAVAKTSVLLRTGASSPYLSNVFSPVRSALSRADKNLASVATLMAAVNLNDVPADQRDQLQQLNDRLPEFRALVSQALDTTDFLSRLAGSSGERRYLVLFQNSSELRPTGGFPGSFGVLVFRDGKFSSFTADDVYRVDGQLKELYEPPLQLQHITPNWAMRDAGWFVDFATSAEKVASFYQKEEGRTVDGVITINPAIAQRILNAIGPVKVPSYNLTLTGDNFLTTLQSIVEYGPDKAQNKPKQVIVDAVPQVVAKLAAASQATWLDVVQAFMAGMEEHDVLLHFTDPQLQQFAEEHGYAGRVHSGPEDYLTVNFTNIKGSKSDAVTATALALDTTLTTSAVRHTLTITRQHNGGSSTYGFYNRQNPAYVRVLVPNGAKLVSISGNSKVSFAPMMNYAKAGFTRDPDLAKLEGSTRTEQGISVLSESGKTEFGFWMVVDPGEIKTAELTYEVPASYAQRNYQLYVQKQPGLVVSQFSWVLHVPDGRAVTDAEPRLTVTDDGYRAVPTLDHDLLLRATVE